MGTGSEILFNRGAHPQWEQIRGLSSIKVDSIPAIGLRWTVRKEVVFRSFCNLRHLIQHERLVIRGGVIHDSERDAECIGPEGRPYGVP